MSFDNCCKCGHKFTKLGEDVPYADGGVMEVIHHGGQCRSCYTKDGHPLCENGHLNYITSKFCHECGIKL